MKYLLPLVGLLLFSCGTTSSDNSNADSSPSDTVSVSKDSALNRLSVIDTVQPTTVKTLIRPSDEETAEIIRQMQPIGFDLLDTMTGDLNRDQYMDMLMIVRDQEDTMREVVILIGDGKTYSVVARNKNAVLCYDCGGVWGDPYEGLAIKNGYFSIEHFGGSNWKWTRIITFKYNAEKNDWFLHRDAGESFHAFDPDKSEENLYNKEDFGKVRFTEYNYDK